MAKTKLELLTVSDFASISQDGKLNIIGIFDQIYVPNLPATHVQFFIVGVISGEPNATENLWLQIESPGSKESVPKQNLEIRIGSNGHSNIIASIANMSIESYGIYRIVISNDEGILGEKEFGIFKTGDPMLVSKKDVKDKYIN